jgi:hypothetical protein
MYSFVNYCLIIINSRPLVSESPHICNRTDNSRTWGRMNKTEIQTMVLSVIYSHVSFIILHYLSIIWTIVSNSRMTDESWIGKVLEGTGSGLLEWDTLAFSCMDSENTQRTSVRIAGLSWDSNQAPPRYKCRVLLHQPAWQWSYERECSANSS